MMCAIVDANRADDVFGPKRSEAGEAFFEWLRNGRGKLVIGGEVRRELARTSAKSWLQQLLLAGRAINVDDGQVDARTKEVRAQCRSDDPHIIALAQLSSARLLYSNDKDLHRDFRNRQLISEPRGRIYSTNESDHFSQNRRRLLGRNDLCKS